MAKFPYKTALIVGVGPGISASLARRLSVLGLTVGLGRSMSISACGRSRSEINTNAAPSTGRN